MTRHEFLRALHTLLQPRFYLEIGVQFGDSLVLANCPSIGVDPAPQVGREIPNATIYPMRSDDFFNEYPDPPTDELDLVFIDGSHLAEDALSDFINAEFWGNERTVIVFDDVLPYNAAIATRVQPPGDWTGDVWKVYYWLKQHRPGLTMHLVDTWPTGTLVVWDIDPNWADGLDSFKVDLTEEDNPPDEILNRTSAIDPFELLKILGERP